MGKTMRVVPLELAEANALVRLWHRHHGPAQGHRFSLGAVSDGVLVGAAIVGRPVARHVDRRAVLEVTRLVTDGTPNACSLLYGAAARVARDLGYERIQTYTGADEPGVSLRAAGWVNEGLAGGDSWQWSKRRRRQAGKGDRQRWAKTLNAAVAWENPAGIGAGTMQGSLPL